MRYNTLIEAIDWLAQRLPPDHPQRRKLLTLHAQPAHRWTAHTAETAHHLLTHDFHTTLTDAGWDTDLLRTTACPHVSVSADDTTIYLTRTCDHTDWVRTIPGITATSTSTWQAPRHQRTLTAIACYTPTTIPADPAPPDIDYIDDQWIIHGPHSGEVHDLLRREHATTTTTTWTLTQPAASILKTLTTTHGYQFSAAAATAYQQQHGPLIFDGTVDGLRGVPITDLATIYDKQRQALHNGGFHTIYDLIHHVPRRYLDLRTPTPIAHMPIGEQSATIATITSMPAYDHRKRRGRLTISDRTERIHVTYFHDASPWHRLRVGDTISVYGRLDQWQPDPHRTPVLQMSNPIITATGTGTPQTHLLPIYAQSPKSKLTTAHLQNAIGEALNRLPHIDDPLTGTDPAIDAMPTRTQAYQLVHNPTSTTDAETGRRRLALDELVRLQLAVGLHRSHLREATGIQNTPTGELRHRLRSRTQWTLTPSQQAAIHAITDDMAAPHPMHRLLQGDVGSGKTLVAMTAAATAVDSGSQVAIMAPTEVLARQLHTDAVTLLGASDGEHSPRIDYLSTSSTSRQRAAVIKRLSQRRTDIVVGTHSLLSDSVSYARLGLVIIDEQHRFGVEQRARLMAQGPHLDNNVQATPDLLIMSATPIPRTAAMTVYGDLDHTLLTDVPPGRQPITTEWIDADIDLSNPDHAPWAQIRTHIHHGHQAYVVCALVDDSETLTAQAATTTAEQLTHGALRGLRIGLVHGKQPSSERDATMRAFAAAELDVLVATSVIEVGVNVPNSTGIVILDPARFGLAQLHQLRGRVGRGAAASTCWLYGPAAGSDSITRLTTMTTTTDGFVIAEADYALRGSGQLLGTNQSGDSDITIADLATDTDLIALAKSIATTLLERDPALARRPALAAEVHRRLGHDAGQRLNRS